VLLIPPPTTCAKERAIPLAQRAAVIAKFAVGIEQIDPRHAHFCRGLGIEACPVWYVHIRSEATV